MAAAALAPVSSVANAQWSQGDCATWALRECSQCHGTGIIGVRHDSVCQCVYRRCFRMVMERWRHCKDQIGRVQCQAQRGAGKRYILCGRPGEEYAADVLLVARRNLNDQEWALFWLHMVKGLEWRECCPRLGMDRGAFFHAVYRIEQRLGRVFRETKPYSLMPSEYFSGGRTINVNAMVRCRVVPHQAKHKWVPLGEMDRESWTRQDRHPWRVFRYAA